MMIQKGTVIGAKQFKGNIEGRDYDSCKLRVMMAVPEGSENECGLNVVELNYGKSDNYPGLSKQRKHIGLIGFDTRLVKQPATEEI